MNHKSNRYIGTQIFIGGFYKINKRKMTRGRILDVLS